MPAVSFETLQAVFRIGKVCAAFYGNMIVIVQVYKLSKFQVAGQRSSLMGYPLHEIAVAYNTVGVMIDYFMAWFVEPGCQVPFSYGHAHPVGKSLPEGPGAGFNSRCIAVFGMARRLDAPLAELFKFCQGQIVAGQMQQAVEQHGTMACGQDKSVPVGPSRIPGAVAQEPGPEDICHGCGAHGHAGMAGIGLLYRVNGEKSYGVDAKLVYGGVLWIHASPRFGEIYI